MGKRNDESRKIDGWDPDDIDYLDNQTKQLSFDSPYGLERGLDGLAESLKPNLTLLEFLLRKFEDEAKKKLEENGLDSEEVIEAWRTLFDVEDFSCLNLLLERDSPSLLSGPELLSMRLQNAAHISFCADRVREDVLKGDAERAAIDMLKLVFTAINVSLHEIITRGIWARRAPFKVRGTDRSPRGILSAFKYALKNSPKKDCVSVWKFLRQYCQGDDKNFNGFDIIFEPRENKIYQYDRQGTSKSIGFRAFQRHLSKIKKSQ